MFSGPEPGIVEAIIEGDSFSFRARGLDLSPSGNQIRVALRIGDDHGETFTRLEGNLGLREIAGQASPFPGASPSDGHLVVRSEGPAPVMSACSALTDQNPTDLSPTNEFNDATKTAEAIAETPPIILSAVPNLTDTPTPRPTFTPRNTATPWIVSTSTIATMYTATNWIIPPLPTLSPVRTPTPVRTAPILPPCDMVDVQDVTVEVGSDFAPSEIFVKTWKFKNIGSCTWNTSYSVVLISGNSMSGPGYLNLPSNVAPGQSIEISINMQAPAEIGNYVGTWMLRNDAGKKFGSGPTSSEPFVVEIDVLAYSTRVV